MNGIIKETIKDVGLLVLSRWREICLIALIVTSAGRVFLVHESRTVVKHLSKLKYVEELELKQKTRLTLEKSVLIRPARLRDYATNKLGLQKPHKIKNISSIKLLSQSETN